MTPSFMTRLRRAAPALLGAGLMIFGASAWSAAGDPLPRCAAGSLSFYQARYLKPGDDTSSTPPTIALDQVTLPAAAGGTASIINIWTEESAPTPINAGSATSVNAGATVAMGMNPQNGYIYAIRAHQGDRDYAPATWRAYTGRIQVLKYGTTGVENLGVIANMPDGTGSPATDRWFQLGPNYNSAAFNPANNELLIANWQTNGATSDLIRVSVAGDAPTYLGTITLSASITAQSGDFAIDATGTYAYGIKTASSGSSNISYKVDLATGVVTDLQSGVGESFSLFGTTRWAPYGGAARLQNGQLAFVGGFSTAAPGVRLMDIPAGTVSSPNYTTTLRAESTDATECLPALPIVTVTCTPDLLVDSADSESVCTVTSNVAVPAGGLTVPLSLTGDSTRYTTTCPASVQIPAGSTSAPTCKIIAVPNTVPGDGSAPVGLALTTPTATAGYTLGTPNTATVTVNDDDPYVATLTCTPATLVDAADNVANCTVTLNAVAPAGGMPVALTPPAGSDRYTSTCGSSLTVLAGASTATCTITATDNVVPGDGSATATVALATPAPTAPYKVGTPNTATVTVNDNDIYTSNLTCTPANLVDAADNVSTCTVTLNGPAPAGGLPITLTPPSSNPRYSTTCASPLTVAAGATSATCTITATPNTTPGDGNVNAVVTLGAGAGYQLGPNASATVAVNNDDEVAAVTPVPTLGQWALMLLSLGLAGGAARRLRRR